MNYLHTLAGRLIREEDGPTAVEYAVMLTFIVLACTVSIAALGQGVVSTFNAIISVLPF